MAADTPAGAAPGDAGLWIVERGAFLVAGTRYAGRNENREIPSMWESDFMPRAAELRAVPGQEHVFYGVVRMSADLPAGEFEYLAAREVASLDGLPPGMVGRQVPAQAYAVFPANDVPDLGRVFDSAYNVWLPRSQEWEVADGVWLEVYPTTYPQDGIIHVYCPVRRRQGR